MSALSFRVWAALAVLTFAGPAAAEKIAIVGGTIHTVTGGTVEGGTVLIDGTTIEEVLPDAQRPAGYRVIDAAGKGVTPGLMNAFGYIGLEEVSNGAGIDDSTVRDTPFRAALDVSVALNPDSTLIPVTRMEGVTRSATGPKFFGGVFAGQGALIHHGDGDSILLSPRAFMLTELGETGGSFGGGSRAAAWAQFENALREADDAAGLGRGALPPEDLMLPRMDREALIPVVQGEMLLIIRANRPADLRQVIALKERRPELRIASLDGREAWRMADDIAAAGLPVILNPRYNLPLSFETLGATRENAARLVAAGVTIAFSTVVNAFTMPHDTRLLPQYAASAVSNGLDWDAALVAMTIRPARIFGIDDRYGSLEPGRDADVVVWSGDPMEVMSAPEHVIIRGAEVELTSRQTVLRDRYSPLRQDDIPYGYPQ